MTTTGNCRKGRGRPAAAALALAVALPLLGAPPASARDTVSIVRDRFGIPHVFAANPEAAAYGVGYAVGEDRLWQAHVYRSAGRGELASTLGPDHIGADRFVRLMGPTEAERRAQLESFPASMRRELEAYTRGLNAAMEEALADPAKTPFEFLIFGAPRPWQATDTIAVIGLMSSRFGGGGANELRNLDMLLHLQDTLGDGPGREAFEDVLPLDDPDSPVTVPMAHVPRKPRGQTGTDIRPSADLTRAADRIEELGARWDASHRRLGLPKFGSNAWVVDGSRTATGRPMLYGGPQMGQAVPQIALEIGLHVRNLHAYGMTFAGAGPGIPIGASTTHAWTTTSGLTDVVDTYVEELHPTNPRVYRFRNAWREMDCRLEVIDVFGAPGPSQEVCRTVHGPVVAPDPADLEPGGVAYTQRVAFDGRMHETGIGFTELMLARNLREASRAVSKVASTHNVLYADHQGNIAFWHAGLYPIRPDGFDPRLPLPGTGEAEWQGFVPFSDVPQAVNPDQGWLTNWNNKPAAGWPSPDNAPWGALNQASRLMSSLAADDDMTFEDMAGVARDAGEIELRALAFRGRMLEAAQATPPDTAQGRRAVELLESWDGYRHDADADGRYDAPGYTIFIRWLDALAPRVFGPDLGPHRGRASLSVLWRVLAPDRVSLPTEHDWLGSRSPDEVMMDAFGEMLASLETRFATPDPDAWRTDVRMWHFGATGVASVGPIPYAERGTYQQVVGFVHGRDRAAGMNAMAPGQSGFVGVLGPSPHVDDQRRMYADWEYKPMPIAPHQVDDVTTVQIPVQ